MGRKAPEAHVSARAVPVAGGIKGAAAATLAHPIAGCLMDHHSALLGQPLHKRLLCLHLCANQVLLDS